MTEAGSNKIRDAYHTQEKWVDRLKEPRCSDEGSEHQFGHAYYFFRYERDAQVWGQKWKTKTGAYEIYKATLDCSDVLDLVFNEYYYESFRTLIEDVIKKMRIEKPNDAIELHAVTNDLINSRKFAAYAGIMYQVNNTDYQGSQDVDAHHEQMRKFNFRKNIRFAVFNLNIISDFAFYMEQKVPGKAKKNPFDK